MEYEMIEESDERIGQYATKKSAMEHAKYLCIKVYKHHVCKTTTWRNLIPKTCWTIVFTPKHKKG